MNVCPIDRRARTEEIEMIDPLAQREEDRKVTEALERALREQERREREREQREQREREREERERENRAGKL